jgi:hypothetical protein
VPGRIWAYTGAILGGAVSIAANVAHSFLPPAGAPQGWAPEPGAIVGAIVWPVFLFIAVEILARTSWPHGWSWNLLKFAGLLPVAGVAAFVSYRHLSGLLAHYGEETIVTIVGPLAVDGLMIMATGALLAGGRAVRANAERVHVALAPEHPQPTKTLTHPATPETTPPAPTEPPVAPATPPARPTPTPAPPRSRPQPTTRVAPPQPTTAKAPSSRSATDISVAAPDRPGPKPKPTGDLLTHARRIVESHRNRTGHAITAGELAVRLRVGTERAQKLLTELEPATDTPVPASADQSTPLEVATAR